MQALPTIARRSIPPLLSGLLIASTALAEPPKIDPIKLPDLGGSKISQPPKPAAAPAEVLPPSLPLGEIHLPPGFKIELFSSGVANARSLALGSEGTLFVGTRGIGKVYALPDSDGDGVADRVITLASGLDYPNGIAFHDGALYVAERQRIIRFPQIEGRLDEPPTPELVYDKLPGGQLDGRQYIRFGPDGLLYLSLGAGCEACDLKGLGQIARLKLEGGRLKPFAYGVHYSGGFDWHPQSKVLWFADNGRDWLPEGTAQDELNRAPITGLHFGFPYCFGANRPDPAVNSLRECSNYTAPEAVLGEHLSPLGMRFYRGEQFPRLYRGRLYLAQHGSWNRSQKRGFRIWMATIENGHKRDEEVFASGWLREDGTVWGRPVDLEVAKDGALLLSDDLAGVIYRISYSR